MDGTLLPFLMVHKQKEGSLVIRNSIPYLLTPHPEFGHVLSIVVNDNHICPLVLVETFDLGLKYLKSFNKDYIIGEVA